MSLDAETAVRSRERTFVVAIMYVVLLCWFLSHRSSMFLIEIWNRDLMRKGVYKFNFSLHHTLAHRKPSTF